MDQKHIADDLFELRTNFIIGNYQAAINEGLSLTHLKDEQQILERDVLIYRSYTAKADYSTVLEDLNDGSSIALQAVRALAGYLSSPSTESEKSVAKIKSLLDKCPQNQELIVRLIAGTLYAAGQDYDQALMVLNQSPSTSGPISLEICALNIQLYILINRVDIAKREHERMKSIDEDATITQLVLAWLNLAQASFERVGDNNIEKIEEAIGTYTELVKKWPATPLLLNGLATCHLMRINQKEELKLAEKELMLSQEKDSGKEETLINLAIVHMHSGRADVAGTRFLKKVKTNTDSTWVKQMDLIEKSFDRSADRIRNASNSS